MRWRSIASPCALFLACTCTLLPPANATREDADAASIAAEVERLSREKRLWPGFDPLAIPLAVYDGENTHLFRHPAPPRAFEQPSGSDPLAHVYEGRHPAVDSNSSADIGGTMTATMILDGTDGASLTELAMTAIHEAFHVFQRVHHPTWQANEGDLFLYPTDDSGVLALRRLETEAFKRSLATTTIAESRCWARLALEYRQSRFDQMDAIFAEYERRSELNEGLATYVALRAAGSKTVAIPANGFAATNIRDRAYTIGPALALLLDDFGPEWSQTLEADDENTLDTLLLEIIREDSRDSQKRCVFSSQEIAEREADARADVAQLSMHRQSLMAEFDARDGWRVVIETLDAAPLWPERFDPLNIVMLGDGLLHRRFLRLANDAGHVEMIDTDGADLDALTYGVGPHPLFQGVRRIIVAGLAEPLLEVDGEVLRLSTSGFSAVFQNAAPRREARTIVVRLPGTNPAPRHP